MTLGHPHECYMKNCPYCGVANLDEVTECERCTQPLSDPFAASLDEPVRPDESCLRCGSPRLVRFAPYVSRWQPRLQLHKAERRPGIIRKLLPGTIPLFSSAKVCFDCGCVFTRMDLPQIQKVVRQKGSDELLSRLQLGHP